jgi:hypothetical protein
MPANGVVVEHVVRWATSLHLPNLENLRFYLVDVEDDRIRTPSMTAHFHSARLYKALSHMRRIEVLLLEGLNADLQDGERLDAPPPARIAR